MKQKTIAIDFDGVLHSYSKGWGDGSCYDGPMPGAIEGIKALLAKYSVYILSTRSPIQIRDWLAKHAPEIPLALVQPFIPFWQVEGVLGISQRKLPAMVYIDDRAFLFKDWEGVIKSSEAFGTWPEPALEFVPREDREKLEVQLAGCLTAAEGATSEPALQGQYGWSLAYQKVLDLRKAYDDLIYQVGTKHEGESRHETARRYISERENAVSDVAKDPTGLAVPAAEQEPPSIKHCVDRFKELEMKGPLERPHIAEGPTPAHIEDTNPPGDL